MMFKFISRVGILIVLLWLLSSSEEKGVITKYSKETEANEVSRLIEIYEKEGIKFSYVVLAQSVLETNWFRSDIYNESKNRFGMKFNRRGLATKSHRGHAFYHSDLASLKDYAAWQKVVLRMRPCETEEDYLKVLDNLPLCRGCRYAEDLEYTEKLRKIMSELRSIEEMQ